MLLKLGLTGLAAYVAYRMLNNAKAYEPVAFARGEATPGPSQVRNAGPEAMRSDLPEWDRTDEASDESFPASDPPAIPRATPAYSAD